MIGSASWTRRFSADHFGEISASGMMQNAVNRGVVRKIAEGPSIAADANIGFAGNGSQHIGQSAGSEPLAIPLCRNPDVRAA